MPNLPPGQQIPGTVRPGAQFPQYGVRTSDNKIIIAHSGADKLKDIAQGYVSWFPSQNAAQNFISGQHGPLAGGGNLPNPLAGLAAIGDFFNRLTEPQTWLRVGEVAAGLLLLYLGLQAAFRGTAMGNAVQRTTSQVRQKGRIALEATGAAIPK
jgi:hypothetical protein